MSLFVNSTLYYGKWVWEAKLVNYDVMQIRKDMVNPLAPVWCGNNFRSAISEHMLRI